MHLRNTLAKGMDAESYSLHTFEALLSQSMDDLGKTTVYISKLLLPTQGCHVCRVHALRRLDIYIRWKNTN